MRHLTSTASESSAPRLALPSVLLCAVACLVGCGDDKTDFADEPEPEVKKKAEARFIHLSGETEPLDVFVTGGSTVVSDVAFPDSTGYQEVPAEEGSFDVAVAGTDGDEHLLTIPATGLAEGTTNTIAIYGPFEDLQAVVLLEDPENLDSIIRIRVVHTAQSYQQIDILNIPSAGNPSLLYDNMAYGDVGMALDVPMGEYTIGVDENGDGAAEVSFAIPEVTSGTAANLFLTETRDGDPLIAAQLSGDTVLRIDP